MQLNIQQIKDYSYCPRMYKFAHVDGIYSGKVTTIENFFDECMKKAVYWFFYCIQDREVPSLKELKNKFGDLYIGDRSITETVFLSRSHRNIARILENRSVLMISNFYETYKNNYGVPILVDKDYELKVNETIVTGTIPIIRENSNKQIELLSFFVDCMKGRKLTLPLVVKYDIEITASSLAFKSVFGRPPDTHAYYGLHSNEECEIVKSTDQYKDFTEMVSSVSTAIQNKLYHPVYNTNCISCVYNKICARI